MEKLKIGVLALQGDFKNHIDVFNALDVKTEEVRQPNDLEGCDALVIPGGESTAMTRQMEFSGLTETIRSFAEKKPLWGTCAGLILMSQKTGCQNVLALELLNIQVDRNAYGSQLDSFSTEIELHLFENKQKFNAIFIRAPIIQSYDRTTVKVLAEYEGKPVLVLQGMHLGSTFHPELTKDLAIHHYFLTLVKKNLGLNKQSN
jgi:5'-phosphate synthase pdxT subunit